MPRRRESVSRRFNRMYRSIQLDVHSLYPSLFSQNETEMTWTDFYESLFPQAKLKRFLASISRNNPENPSNLKVL